MQITILFTDNLISRNRARWSAAEIQRMPNLIVGHRATLDHAWESVENRWGVVTSAKAVKGTAIGILSPEETAIVDKEGYWYGEATIEVPDIASKSDIIQMISGGLLSENSIGFAYKFMRCPNCECAAGDLRSPKCPNSYEDISYYERVDVQEVFEVSFVEIPDVRRARILEIDSVKVEELLRSPEQFMEINDVRRARILEIDSVKVEELLRSPEQFMEIPDVRRARILEIDSVKVEELLRSPEQYGQAKYESINFRPPQGARDEAEKGLNWRQEFGRGGTAIGIARARDIKNGVTLSPDTLRRMKSYFARHEVDKQAEGFRPGEKGYPSNGRIAWALWGGDAGKSWADKVVDQMDSEDEDD
jgi:hypothetical protein